MIWVLGTRLQPLVQEIHIYYRYHRLDGLRRVLVMFQRVGPNYRRGWTRGAAFPVSDLASRLKCPSCGSRRVALVFHMPKEPQAVKAKRTA